MCACPLCNSTKFKKLDVINGKKLVKCARCSLVFYNPLPTAKELSLLYQKTSPYMDLPKCFDPRNPSDSLAKFNHICTFDEIKIIKKYKKKGRILDIGCSIGILLNKVKRMGLETYGIELDTKAAQLARKKLGLKVFTKPLIENHFSNKFFDVITVLEVVEHLKDHIKFFKEINRILKDDGIVLIHTPNAESLYATKLKGDWPMFHRSGHICFFSPDTIKILLRNTGFESIGKPIYQGGLYLPSPFRQIDQNRFFQTAYSKLPFLAQIRKYFMHWFKYGDNIFIVAKKVRHLEN